MKMTSKNKAMTECQFNVFCKTVLRNEARNIYLEEKRWNKKFISIDDLTQEQVNRLGKCDRYETEMTHFNTQGCTVSIEDTSLASAILRLSKKQQDIILNSFFLEMKDVEIAQLMNIAKSTLHYHKERAVKELKKLIKEKD